MNGVWVHVGHTNRIRAAICAQGCVHHGVVVQAYQSSDPARCIMGDGAEAKKNGSRQVKSSVVKKTNHGARQGKKGKGVSGATATVVHGGGLTKWEMHKISVAYCAARCVCGLLAKVMGFQEPGGSVNMGSEAVADPVHLTVAQYHGRMLSKMLQDVARKQNMQTQEHAGGE